MLRLENINNTFGFEVSGSPVKASSVAGAQIPKKALRSFTCSFSSKGFLYLSSFSSGMTGPVSNESLISLTIYRFSATTIFMRPKFSRLKIWTLTGIIEKWCGLVSQKLLVGSSASKKAIW